MRNTRKAGIRPESPSRAFVGGRSTRSDGTLTLTTGFDDEVEME